MQFTRESRLDGSAEHYLTIRTADGATEAELIGYTQLRELPFRDGPHGQRVTVLKPRWCYRLDMADPWQPISWELAPDERAALLRLVNAYFGRMIYPPKPKPSKTAALAAFC